MSTTKTDSYYGLNGVIKLQRDDGGSTPVEVTVGIVQNWKAECTFEVNPLYGMGSIVYQAVARGKMEAKVECEWCSFNIGSLAKIIDPEFVDSGTTGTTTVEIKQRTSTSNNGDTTKVFNKFIFEGTFVGQAGNTATLTVSGVYFESFPWEASSDDWVKMNMTGMGNAFKIVETE